MKRVKQNGFLLYIGAVLIFVFGFVAILVADLSITGHQQSTQKNAQLSAFDIAQMGLARAQNALFSDTNPATIDQGYIGPRVACSAITGDSDFTNAAYGNGHFTLTATLFDNSTSSDQLSQTITDGDTMIPVNSLNNIDSESGRIRIDREWIDYDQTSTNPADCGGANACFLNVTRGADGSEKASHTINTPISQYQCDVTSTAGVPVLSPIGEVHAKRELEAKYQLESGFLMRDGDGVIKILAWNLAANPNTWAEMSSGTAQGLNYNGVSELSPRDIWAVGDSGHIMHNDGSGWQAVTQITETKNLNRIDCVSHHECWAVGDDNTVYKYNSGTWTKVDVGTSADDLNAVSCPVSGDCWVGADKGKIYHCSGTTCDSGQIVGSANINGIDCIGTNFCLAVATSGYTYRYNGSNWTALGQVNGNKSLYDVHCMNDQNCWVTGISGWTFHYVAGSWDNGEDVESSNRGIYCLNDHNCWTGGYSERLSHYDGTTWIRYHDLSSKYYNGIDMVGAKGDPRINWQEIVH